ncbi:serine/threonine protein kinase [Nocardia otitidiscaviarum]|uniref:non-specific serine/threonine protein kinase n=2 Tax=root TaxID=1 RepID=A0A516NQG1_9NOCA|nr:serine/threonine-protein kinase [Nocardia otitidiscaviarum]MCP9620284.1 serine/threonine protein kinase [Nocardia otitidiscaviarum]QDP81146.1 serine/threonine protein kinase [Nocardia otitidiscaviarum]
MSVRDLTGEDTDRVRAALPGYVIDGQVGRGGCGVVLAGTHRGLGRRVAIKQIPPQFAHDAQVRRRFVGEARLMAAIDHPHVVPVYDFIERADLCLLVMEYLPGGTVESRFATDGFDAAAAVAVALSCAAGLEAAHRHGILHRDVKPSNLMFSRRGALKLTDFGIAKIVGGDETLVTRAGEIIGTPSYIAPEQVRGQQLSPATDVYALSTMLYQLLSGVLPFPPDSDQLAMLFAHAYGEPAPLLDVAPGVPEPIADVVMRGLTPDPDHRFATAESFGIALAAPAALCWGVNWLPPVGIPVIGADTIVAAATGGRWSQGPQTGYVPRDPLPVRRSMPTARMLPREPVARTGARLVDVERADLIPVQRVVHLSSPRVPLLVAGVLAMLTVGVAVLGLGPGPNRDLPALDTIRVGGVDVAAGEPIEIDLSRPVPISVTGTDADAATLAVVVLGTATGGTATPLSAGPSGASAEVPAPVHRYVIAGDLTARLTLSRAGIETATYDFGVRTTQSPYPTAAAVGTLLLALFAGAYAESNARALRAGGARFAAAVGLTLSCALLAVAAVGAVWVLLGSEPARTTVIGCAVLGAATGSAAAVACRRLGRRRRYLRITRLRDLLREP